MQSDANQPATNRRVTVFEAADILGISPEAVRARIKRGTLDKEKGPDGTVYVRLDATQERRDADGTGDGTSDLVLTIERLDSEVQFLRAELARRDEEMRRREERHAEEARRKDHLLAAALERIPELEPASEPRESPVTAAEADPGTQAAPPESPKGIWRRLFGR
jgi:hypothetical protein